MIWTRAYTPVAHAAINVKALKDELGMAANAMNVNANYYGGRANWEFDATHGPLYDYATEEAYGKFILVSNPHPTNDIVQATMLAANCSNTDFTRIVIPAGSQAMVAHNSFGQAKAYKFLMGVKRWNAGDTMIIRNRGASNYLSEYAFIVRDDALPISGAGVESDQGQHPFGTQILNTASAYRYTPITIKAVYNSGLASYNIQFRIGASCTGVNEDTDLIFVLMGFYV